jgi:undecaprenyldiphospho-muramoylpentapeptide beta-N-acetylglucosaminyltransferase
MRLLICAGGTGGGVYPALAVLQALQQHNLPDLEVLWIGGEGGMEANLVKRDGIPYQAIPAAGVHGVGLPALPGNLLRVGRGFLAARAILRQYRPDIIFYTGGYVAAPLALASRVERRSPSRSVMYVPDIEPGMAHKFLARFADAIAVTAPESQHYFPATARVTVTGYPTRHSLQKWERSKARKHLGLSTEWPVLLVFGGSKGARSINKALIAALPALLAVMQVIHISGEANWNDVANNQSLPADLAERYHPFPYLHDEMGAALSIADLVVSRAGASSLGEFPFFRLPAILVPYPYAWRYQKVNAGYLERQGAVLVLRDDDLGDKLQETILSLITDHDRLNMMRVAMGNCAQPKAALAIASILLETAAVQQMESER